MGVHPPMQDDFWDDITDSICATIEADCAIPDDDSKQLLPAQVGSHEADEVFTLAPSSPDDKQYLMESRARSQFESLMAVEIHHLHQKIHRFTPEASHERISTPFISDVGSNDLKLNSRLERISGTLQNPTGGTEAVMIPYNSHTTTPGLIGKNDQIKMLRSMHATSPTPQYGVASEVSKESVSPNTPASNGTRRTKRRLSFGMPTFDNDERLKMPPSRTRQASLSSEDDFFWHCLNADALAPAQAEITFNHIRRSSTGDFQTDNQTPKTPVLQDFGSPSLPLVIEENTDESYPKCCDGFLVDIPRHHLNSLRRAVDPTFQNEQYWGDDLYFLEEPVYSHFCDQSTAYDFHRRDWSIIFHALENDVDHRIPLPDTRTESRFRLEQLDRIWSTFEDGDQQPAIFEAQLPRESTEVQMDEAGLTWSEARGRYYDDPPEFTTRSSWDICESLEFRIFCFLARFIDGRPAIMPKGLALRDTLAVLKYARLHVASPRPQVDQIVQEQMMPAPRHTIPVDASLPQRAAIAVETGVLAYSSSSPAPETTQRPSQELSQPHQQSNQVAIPPQNPMSIVHRAYHDPRAFMTLPQEYLLGAQRQWLQARAQQFTNQGRPLPNTLPTAEQVWVFFRRTVKAREIARRRQQAVRETAAQEDAQASMLRNLFVQQPDMPISGRPVQLQSHMPGLPPQDSLQTNSTRNMLASATPLGNPFLTPVRARNGTIGHRLS